MQEKKQEIMNRENLQQEADICRHEINSLKALLKGKDALISRRQQTLNQTKVRNWIVSISLSICTIFVILFHTYWNTKI